MLTRTHSQDLRLLPQRQCDARGEARMASLAAIGCALAVVACFVSAPRNVPLPAIPWAAAFLLLAVQQDVHRLRIPNWLTFPAMAVALALGAFAGGSAGLLTALTGMAAAFAIVIVPFGLRWLGAGDAKACLVLGALWGAQHFVGTVWWMALAGGGLALVFLTLRGGLLDMLRRWGRSLAASLTLRRLTYFEPEPGSPARSGVPFAVAMALGATAYQMWGSPWQ